MRGPAWLFGLRKAGNSLPGLRKDNAVAMPAERNLHECAHEVLFVSLEIKNNEVVVLLGTDANCPGQLHMLASPIDA